MHVVRILFQSTMDTLDLGIMSALGSILPPSDRPQLFGPCISPQEAFPHRSIWSHWSFRRCHRKSKPVLFRYFQCSDEARLQRPEQDCFCILCLLTTLCR